MNYVCSAGKFYLYQLSEYNYIIKRDFGGKEEKIASIKFDTKLQEPKTISHCIQDTISNEEYKDFIRLVDEVKNRSTGW
jgi:hypothetical protein